MNFANIMHTITLGVTDKNGDDFNVLIEPILIEDNNQVYSTSGIFKLFKDAYWNDIDENIEEKETLNENEIPGFLGKILFDNNSDWIYDGDKLTIDEQIQVGEYLKNYTEYDVE